MNANDKWTVDRLIERYPGRFPELDRYCTGGFITDDDYDRFYDDVRDMIEWILETDRKDRTQ